MNGIIFIQKSVLSVEYSKQKKITNQVNFIPFQIRRKMEAVCFLCQDFKANVGHETITCPKSECKNCGQHGHFRINCKFKSMITPWFKAKNAKRFVFTRFLIRELYLIIEEFSSFDEQTKILEVPDPEVIFLTV